MKKSLVAVWAITSFLFFPISKGIAADALLEPVVGLSLFGGAERGGTGSGQRAGAIGGSELMGLVPLASRLGLQGSLLNQGGNGGYRLGVSAGPVYAYSSGKIGLFGDYVHQERDSLNFFYLRGAWSHYFDTFDLVLSYSQPVNHLQHVSHTVADTVTPNPQCPSAPLPPPTLRRVRTSVPAINELKAVVRYYPTQRTEVNLGFLVNSFAGPDHNDPGTGVGGVFGAAIQIFDWLILRPVQGQIDSRNRYRVTSGVELTWTPVPEFKVLPTREGNFSTVGSASGTSTPNVCGPVGIPVGVFGD